MDIGSRGTRDKPRALLYSYQAKAAMTAPRE